MHRPKIYFVIAIASYLLGAGLTLNALYYIYTAVQVQATVTKHEIVRHSDTDDDTYTPHVTFRFIYEGIGYEPDNIRPGMQEGYSSRSLAQIAADDFPIGSTVTAYVPKSAPLNAFLIPEPSYVSIAFVLLGLGFLCGALYVRLSSVTHWPGRSYSEYYFLWPLLILAAGSLVAVPWTIVTKDAQVTTIATWAFTLLLTVTPPMLVIVSKNRYDPYPADDSLD